MRENIKKYFILSLVCIFSEEAMGMGEETSRIFRIQGSSLKKCSQAPAPIPVKIEEEFYPEPEEIYYKGQPLSKMSEKEAIAALRAMYDQSGRLRAH